MEGGGLSYFLARARKGGNAITIYPITFMEDEKKDEENGEKNYRRHG
jgi:hypothetical protein